MSNNVKDILAAIIFAIAFNAIVLSFFTWWVLT